MAFWLFPPPFSFTFPFSLFFKFFFSMNLFVARLSYNTDDDGLRNAFEAYGEVDSARVIMDKETGRSRGFGFVEMENDDEAKAAMEGLHEADLDGRFIVVREANKEGGGGGGDRRGGGGGSRGGYGGGGGGGRGGYGGGGGGGRGGYGGGGGRREW